MAQTCICEQDIQASSLSLDPFGNAQHVGLTGGIGFNADGRPTEFRDRFAECFLAPSIDIEE